MAKDEEEFRGEVEERLINEEYKIWKKNTPFLYDLVITHALEWPSLTLQWMPDREEPPGKDYSVQKMILGTHTSENEPNYLTIAQVHLPIDDADNDARLYDDDRGDIGGFGCASGKMKTEAYILEIHHGGNWSKRKRMSEYIDGKLNYYHGIVDGKTSLRELFGIVRGIMDIGSKEFKVFCGCPQDVGCSLGVFELRNELDLIQMFSAYEGLHTIQLFIEVVDEHVEEIQQEEDKLESDVESIQSQCYDSDNLLPICSDSGGEKINYKVVHLNHDPKEVPELTVGFGFGSAADFRHAVRQNARYGGRTPRLTSLENKL